MYDVVFITPNMSGETKNEEIGPLLLATILTQKGVSCDILPFYRIGQLDDFDAFIESTMSLLEQRQPKIVSFYTRCDVYHIDLRLAQRIKARWPEVYVVFGGPQSDITAEETIRQIPVVDFVCCGEGENTVYPLFQSLFAGKPDLSIPGLVYRVGDEVRRNPRPEQIKDLDDLPMLDYGLIHLKPVAPDSEDVFAIDVGRGCPFGCTFCSTKSFWGRKFRLKSPQRICQEIRQIHDQYGYTRFSLSHDMFTFNRNKVYETCEILRKMKFPIQWGCSARLDCIDQEMIDVMARSGMVGIYIGIESGSPRMQKIINKRLKLEDAVEKIAYLKSKGIRTTASFIYGFPEETEEDVSQTIALIGKLLKLRTVTVQTHLCAFFAGTELCDRYGPELTPTQHFSDQTGRFAITECRDLIDGHKALFSQMLEYKTPMRTRLRYFEIFMAMWKYMQPVYQYISEKYPENRLIDMYDDFVQANQELLDQIKDRPEQWTDQLVLRDRLPERFAGDENYDLMQDLYRFYAANESEAVRNGGTVTDFYCFAPSSIKKYETLQEYPRCIAMVTLNKSGFKELCSPQ